MNKFIAVGRATRDPEIRYTDGQNQTCIARFSIAVDRRYKKGNDDTADFFDAVAFGKTGEFVEKYVTKGMKLICVGRMENNNYTNRDGQKVYGMRFVVEEIEFAESKKTDSAKQEGPKQPAPQETPKETEWMNIPDGVSDEELPFI